jgi:regulator of cell morphogenesis and NO signaling
MGHTRQLRVSGSRNRDNRRVPTGSMRWASPRQPAIPARSMLKQHHTLVQPDQTVAQIVLNHPQCARIFAEHGIDFCCGGKALLGDACAALGPEGDAVLEELDRAIDTGHTRRDERDPRTLSNLQLVAHIVDTHHVSLRKALAFLQPLAGKVAAAHAAQQPALNSVHAELVGLCAVFEPHLEWEESAVFPLLLSSHPPRQRVQEELAWMQEDHVRVGDALHRLRTLTDRFQVPPWACTSYRTLMAELQTMERDTFEHVHLENNVLAQRFL